ncbi:MAG TPA: VWA domain-containing protein [Pyrinomonadaceae bacterium]|nr:VWA domain-containing protein [Pyrinomonadaceae bacterium]
MKSPGFICIGVLVVISAAFMAPAQTPCLQPGKLAELKKQIAAAPASAAEDKRLHDQIVAAATELVAKTRQAAIDLDKNKFSTKAIDSLKQEYTTLICTQLNSQGWPMKASVGRDGINSFLFLISKALPNDMQFELYPLVLDAFAKGEFERGELLASLIDRLRLLTGDKQFFGTQVYSRDGFLVLAPIDDPGRVDRRRADFQMSPLRSYERYLERSYQRPLIRSVMAPISEGGSASPAVKETALQSPSVADDEKEVIKVNTSFVSMDVVVPDLISTSVTLEKKDFRVFEDDKPVDIESFSKSDSPFDIVLLLDVSGSTADKLSLVRKTTRRFVEMKRPTDRVAVVAFHSSPTVVSPFESDSQVLLSRLKDIKGTGGSQIWDAVKFGMDMLGKDGEKGRRKAIVLMSDGADNSLMYFSGFGSTISFADLVESVQRGSTSIFPIYLDTEGGDAASKRIYADARRTLTYLADQSGGKMYYAKKIEDLTTVYDTVLKDVGTVYSLGFEPNEGENKNRWRTLKVIIQEHPELKVKHRPGYFVR